MKLSVYDYYHLLLFYLRVYGEHFSFHCILRFFKPLIERKHQAMPAVDIHSLAKKGETEKLKQEIEKSPERIHETESVSR